MFSYDHLYHSYKMCRRGVSWKASVQKYITQAPLNVYQTEVKLQTGKFRTTGFTEFNLCERGKIRHIRSVGISERVVQRCLCDYALVPMLGRTYIYDNGASTERKGYTFAIRRLCQHLREHYRKHGAEGYVLLFDFSKFFDRVSHRLVRAITRKEFTDERIIKITDHFVDAFGDIGLGLGSQVSQVFALASANRLDHYIKEVCRIRGYGRYMDDGYLIHPSKEYLQSCLLHIQAICDELEIKLNTKKTQIVKLTHGFTYLKVRFFLLESGILMHRTNHPYTLHLQSSVWEVDPKEVCAGRPVGLAWFSPDCKHFSKARGDIPVNKEIRALAWVTVKWALDVKPRVIMLENVEEFQTWGPLIKVIIKGEEKWIPDPERAGETFRAFIGALSTGVPADHPALDEVCEYLKIKKGSPELQRVIDGLGYDVEFKELVAADYGAPTTRKRFVLVARCDNKPIVWPKRTHAPRDSAEVKSGKLAAWIPAAEIIDWSLP